VNAQAEYQQKKLAKREQQRSRWAEIKALPMAGQAEALFAYWPQKLPRWLDRRLPPTSRQEWSKLRADSAAARFAAIMEHMGLSPKIDMTLAIDAALERHAFALDGIAAVIDTMSGARQFTVNMESPSGYGQMTAKESLDDRQKVAEKESLRAILAMGIEAGGSVVIRQATVARVMMPDPSTGKPAWFSQSRVYGALLGNGTWNPISVSQMREAHNTDSQTGQRLEPEPGVIFGSLKDFVSASRAKSRPH
jgi:hypothetical protein